MINLFCKNGIKWKSRDFLIRSQNCKPTLFKDDLNLNIHVFVNCSERKFFTIEFQCILYTLQSVIYLALSFTIVFIIGRKYSDTFSFFTEFNVASKPGQLGDLPALTVEKDPRLIAG